MNKKDTLNLYRQLLKGIKKYPSIKRDDLYLEIKEGELKMIPNILK